MGAECVQNVSDVVGLALVDDDVGVGFIERAPLVVEVAEGVARGHDDAAVGKVAQPLLYRLKGQAQVDHRAHGLEMLHGGGTVHCAPSRGDDRGDVVVAQGQVDSLLDGKKARLAFLADDAVEISRISGNTLIGTAPELIRNYLELRGIGIVNVARLFGMGAVRSDKKIDLVVNIVPWKAHEVYDRLGLEDQYMDILGVKVPMYTIPITPGRNLAVIMEVAAINNRQRKMGYNSAVEFTEQINRHFEQNLGQPV